MAHFAQIDDTNKVLQVIVVSNDDCGGGDFPASEPIGQAFIASIGLSGTWLQTSYFGSFRYNYAGIAYQYLVEGDAFVAPQPYPSWTLNAQYQWQAPLPYPSDGNSYYWDEKTGTWQPLRV